MIRSRFAPLWLLPLLLHHSCAMPRQEQGQQSLVAPLPADLPATVARHEAAREDGDGLLGALAARGPLETRIAAVRALGRMAGHEPAPRVLEALRAAAGDAAPQVRAEAAFALGLHADAGSLAVLRKLAEDEDATVRERAVDALSKTPGSAARTATLAALDDKELAVRCAALLGAARFDKQAADLPAAVERLAAFATARELDVEEAWRALHAQARLGTSALRSLAVARAADADVRVRIFAMQAFARGPHDEASRAALAAGLRDADPRVAQEAALALRANPDTALLEALLEAARSPWTSTRVCALEALGEAGKRVPWIDVVQEDEPHARIEAAFDRARGDDSPSVRGARLEGAARMSGNGAAPMLELARMDKDPIVRAAAARAAAFLDAAHGVPLVRSLAEDPDLRVATTAADILGTWDEPAAREAALRLLDHADEGVRLAAMGALAKIGTADMGPRVLAAALGCTGPIGAEVAQVALDCAAKMDDKAIAQRLAQHPDDYVARKAARLLRERWKTEPKPRRSRAMWRTPPDTLDLPRGARIATTRGSFELALHGDEAPLHVHNFAQLVARRSYDGLSFHRVVPDFVAQGGDPRGDGNGGGAWDGGALRAEFTPRRYLAGSLGMPRNDDPDSGGCQVFFTLRDTPHLDGRYTNFGTVTAGLDVLQRLEVGDRILAVELLR